MQSLITTTELRTKAAELVDALKNGVTISLIHRSKVIGRILPDKNTELKTINIKNLETKINKLNLPRLTLKEIERRYRIAMMKKHGQGLR